MQVELYTERNSVPEISLEINIQRRFLITRYDSQLEYQNKFMQVHLAAFC